MIDGIKGIQKNKEGIVPNKSFYEKQRNPERDLKEISILFAKRDDEEARQEEESLRTEAAQAEKMGKDLSDPNTKPEERKQKWGKILFKSKHPGAMAAIAIFSTALNLALPNKTEASETSDLIKNIAIGVMLENTIPGSTGFAKVENGHYSVEATMAILSVHFSSLSDGNIERQVRGFNADQRRILCEAVVHGDTQNFNARANNMSAEGKIEMIRILMLDIDPADKAAQIEDLLEREEEKRRDEEQRRKDEIERMEEEARDRAMRQRDANASELYDSNKVNDVAIDWRNSIVAKRYPEEFQKNYTPLDKMEVEDETGTFTDISIQEYQNLNYRQYCIEENGWVDELSTIRAVVLTEKWVKEVRVQESGGKMVTKKIYHTLEIISLPTEKAQVGQSGQLIVGLKTEKDENGVTLRDRENITDKDGELTRILEMEFGKQLDKSHKQKEKEESELLEQLGYPAKQ